ncbi:MAG: flagellar hook-associated protein FlgK [Polyangiaceae bacterium]|nr:flagellar hook-associated protein FlgK [Polyangiaceae bacterium]
MASLTQMLLTARDALSAQSYALGVTGQNITSSTTPAYVRREALLENRATGGVVAVGVRRVADQFGDRRWLAASSLGASASEREALLSRVEPLFDDVGGSGVGTALDQLFAGFSQLGSSPSDTTTRQALLDRAGALAARLRENADSIASQREELLSRAQSVVTEINGKAAQVADLNRKIALAEAQGDDASSLRDQRDKLLLGLSSEVDITTFVDGQGGLVVRAAGTTLIEGDVAQAFEVDLAGDGSLRLLVAQTGPPAMDVTASLSGGSLAAIKEVRDSDLGSMATQLDQFAWDLAAAVNAQHAAGFGLDGVGGRALFSISATPTGAARSIALDAQMLGHPERLAASSLATTLPGGSDNAVALAGLSAQKLFTGNTRTASGAWSDLVGDVGSRVARARSETELRQGVQAQVDSLRESLSGVSLDEEMVSLTKYQHAYDAAAKVLATVDELLRELLDKVGR